MRRKILGGLACVALLGAVAGCGDTKQTAAAAASVTPDARVRLLMTTVDGDTGVPVKATLTVCGFGTFQADSSGLIEADIIGVVNSQPLTVRVDASGYASQSGQVSVNINDASGATDNNTHDITVQNLGSLELGKSQTLKVEVVGDGSPISGASVHAILSTNTSSGPCQVVLTGSTNSTGIAQISGIDPGTGTSLGGQSPIYTIIADVPNQGPAPKFLATAFGGYRMGIFGDTITINLNDQGAPAAPVQVIGTSAEPFDGASFSMFQGAIVDVAPATSPYGVATLGQGARTGFDISVNPQNSIFTSDGSVEVFFQTPVNIVNDPNQNFVTEFQFVNALTTPATLTASPAPSIVTGTATAVSGTLNTVWKITPASSIPLNAEYGITFYAESAVDTHGNNNTTATQISAEGTDGSFFYHAPSPTSIASPLVDNYNGTTASGTAAPVFLEFDEVVSGSYAVLGFTSAGTTFNNAQGNNNNVTIGVNGQASMSFNSSSGTAAHGGQIGATSGTRFRVPLMTSSGSIPLALADGESVTIAVNVRDAMGNTLQKTFVLTVK